jgi:hypothetical protein
MLMNGKKRRKASAINPGASRATAPKAIRPRFGVISSAGAAGATSIIPNDSEGEMLTSYSLARAQETLRYCPRARRDRTCQ